MTDQFAWWKAAVRGEPVTVTADRIESGFYFAKASKRGGRVPVAIWRNDAGELVGRWGSENSRKAMAADEIAAQWTFVSGNPVLRTDYQHAFDHNHWPDGTPTTAPKDDNASADPFVSVLDQARDKIETAKSFLSGGPAKDKTRADMARNIQAGLLALKKEADGLHKAEKQPHLDASRAVDDKFRFRDELDAIAKELRTVFEAFAKAEEARLRAEAQAKFEAERAAAEAERKRILDEQAKQMRDDPIAAMTSPAPELPKVPEKPAEVKVQIGGGMGRASGLKTVHVPEITDYAATLKHYADHPDVVALIDKLVKASVRVAKGKITIPGVVIKEDRVAA